EFLKRIRGEGPMNRDAQEDEDEAFKEAEEPHTPKEDIDLKAETEARREKETDHESDAPRFERIKTGRSIRTQNSDIEWDDNPYVIDRVHTRESFKSGKKVRSRSASKESRP